MGWGFWMGRLLGRMREVWILVWRWRWIGYFGVGILGYVVVDLAAASSESFFLYLFLRLVNLSLCHLSFVSRRPHH